MTDIKRRHSPKMAHAQITDPPASSKMQTLDTTDALDYAAAMAEELAFLVIRLGEHTAGDQLLFASANLRVALRKESIRRANASLVNGPSREQ